MKEMNIFEATALTSPNLLTMVCTANEDGTTNLAPLCFVSYLSFDPAMIGFAAGKQSHTGKRVRDTGKAIIAVPGNSLAEAVVACGASTGADTNKVEQFGIEMMSVEGSDIQAPADSKLLFLVDLAQSMEVGDHILHVCTIEKILGDESVKNLYAWNGFGVVAPAKMEE